jgi:hypothetical protein
MASSRNGHPENCPNFMTLADITWGSTRPLKPLRKICDFDLMFDTNVSNGDLHYTELLLGAFHPFIFAQCC